MGRLRLLALLLAFGLLALGLDGAAGAAQAGPGATYSAQLSGGEEAPPRTTPASGQASFRVSADGMSMTYRVTVSAISNVTAGHIHIAPRGANGDIVLPIVPNAAPGGGPRSGVIGEGTVTAAQPVGPLAGKPLLDLIAQMDAGNAYVNIHTGSGTSPATMMPGDFPPGEVRGQIMMGTMPSSVPSTGGGFGARGAAPVDRVVFAAVLALAATGIIGARSRWRA